MASVPFLAEGSRLNGRTSARLDTLAVAAYKHLLVHGRRNDSQLCQEFDVCPERVDDAYRLLAELRVVESTANGTDGWHAVEPQLAISMLVLPIEDEVRRGAAAAEQLRGQLKSLIPVYQEIAAATHPQQHIEIVEDVAALAAINAEELAACRDTIHYLHASGDDFLANRALPGVLDGGVALRGIYQHSARFDQFTESLVKRLAGEPGSFRTVAELPATIIIFDDTCCLASPATPGASPTIVIRHPLMVTIMDSLWCAFWEQGIPFPGPEIDDSRVTDLIKQAILRLLGSGSKDEAIAHRLGVSVRTCRRHISDIMQDLNAQSRFQAGVEAHSRGLITPRLSSVQADDVRLEASGRTLAARGQ
jgi:DNA-binding CsgD family transcriptional regulator